MSRHKFCMSRHRLNRLKEIPGRDMVFYVATERCVGWDTLGRDIDF